MSSRGSGIAAKNPYFMGTLAAREAPYSLIWRASLMAAVPWMTSGPGAVTERMLVSMDWSFENDVSISGVHLGIGNPDGSLRPPISKTWEILGKL